MTAFVFFKGNDFDYFSHLERKAEAPSEQAQLVPARINLRSFP
jgi:hypothetical protein